MRELLYTAEGRLLDGERELVSLDSSIGPFGRFSSEGVEYDIARRKHSGWHMELTDTRTSGQVCEFVPHHVGRGGELRSGDQVVKLKGRPLGPSHWSFASADGEHLDASSRREEGSGTGPFSRLEVKLEGGEWVGAPPIAPLTLAFGCWLIVQWETDIQRTGRTFVGS